MAFKHKQSVLNIVYLFLFCLLEFFCLDDYSGFKSIYLYVSIIFIAFWLKRFEFKNIMSAFVFLASAIIIYSVYTLCEKLIYFYSNYNLSFQYFVIGIFLGVLKLGLTIGMIQNYVNKKETSI